MDPMTAVRQFVSEQCDFDGPLQDDEDIFRRVGITGDDAADFVQSFVARFEVDMSSYLWHFHTEEEGFNVGAGLFLSPEQKVARIPITLRLLAEAVSLNTWPVEYPDHEPPRLRNDILVNRTILVAVLGGLAFTILLMFIR